MRPPSRRPRRVLPIRSVPVSPSGFVASRISVSHSRSARSGAASHALPDALTSEPRLANASFHELDRQAGDSAGWRLADRDATWEATARGDTYVLHGNAECVPGGALRARFEALSRAIARSLEPDTLTRVELRYVYTILLGPNRLATAGIVSEPLLRQNVATPSHAAHGAPSAPELDAAMTEMRFPLDGSIWLTCRHGFARSAFGRTYLLDSELCRADVTRFEPAALLEALDAMHCDQRRVLHTCLTESAIATLFPSP